MIRNYGLVESVEELTSIMQKFLEDGTAVGLDIETGYDGPDKAKASVHPEEGFITGISFTNSLDWARYVPLRHDFEDNFDNKTVAELLWPVAQAGLIVPHNGSFELGFMMPWFREYLGEDIVGYDCFPLRSDTKVELYVLSAYPNSELKGVVETIFGHTMCHFIDLFPGAAKNKAKTLRFNVLPLTQEVVDYACEDSLWALALHQRHYDLVKDHFIYQLEMQVLYIVHEMERYGLYFDWATMREYSEKAKAFSEIQYADIQETFSEMLGEPVSVNLNSPKQVSEILYERLGFSTTRFTKSSQDSDDPKMSTDAKALEGLAKKHPVVRKVLEYKEVTKLVGSYLDKYERDFGYDILNEGVTHPHHSQLYVISGRFSVSDPGYQQLPGGNCVPEEGPLKGKKVTRYECGDQVFEMCFRDVVVCPPDHYGVGFDYSAAELRALAGEAKEEALLDAFVKNIDVHRRTAALMLGIPEEEVTPPQRQVGKTNNFSILYGQGVKAMAEQLGIPIEEAQDLYDKYMSAYSSIARFIEEKQEFGRKHGYSLTKFGRKMTIWEYQDKRNWAQSKADRMAVNTVIQGSATGDVPKIAMVRAVRAIKAAGLQDKVHLVMNIHDALEFYVHKSVDMQTVIDLLEPAVVFPVSGWPPLKADWHTWVSWGSCKEVHRDDKGQWVEAA